tara:strand:+ start:125 stop:1186 length:1062 start_codon:yes stop_codon:yes gene_type:complete
MSGLNFMSSLDKTGLQEMKFLDEMIDQVIILDKSKNICCANKSAIDRFGPNIEGQSISSILRDSNLLENIDLSVSDEKAKIIDIEIKLPNFQFYKANIIPGPSKLCDQDQSVIIFLKDLTEIYKTQKFKSDFVANVSHELRTPLQSIKLGLETINKGHAENDFESQKKFMPIIIQQTERMESLVNDLLSLSKIELQEHIRPTTEADLNEIISHVIKVNSDLLKKRESVVNYKADKGSHKILGNRDRLIEIFTNLLDNASKYSNKGVSINISLKIKDNSILYSIKDNGVGIPKKYLPRITERFFRVNPAKSKEVGGTGLGLAIVKHIVNQHRASMNILSEEGKGTEFLIEFPKL